MERDKDYKAILDSLGKLFAIELVPVLEKLREDERQQIEDTKNTSVD